MRVLIAGAGLAGVLIASMLRARFPSWNITLIDRLSAVGQNRTWSVHMAAHAMPDWLNALCPLSWPGYSVLFPGLKRELYGIEDHYFTFTSAHCHSVLSGVAVLNQEILNIQPKGVTLGDGRFISADLVFDTIGFGSTDSQSVQTVKTGYQKFLGQKIKFKQPHGLRFPILMDAKLEQKEGFRFMYVLPFDQTTLLIEDTRYSLTSEIDEADFRASIARYASEKWSSNYLLLEEEQAALPIPLDSPMSTVKSALSRSGEVIQIGSRFGHYHWVTGYSFPVLLNLVLEIENVLLAATGLSVPNTVAAVHKAILCFNAELELQGRFLLRINRLMFYGAPDATRYKMLKHFYKLPSALIARFYKARLGRLDRVRFFLGYPPIPIHKALSIYLREVFG